MPDEIYTEVASLRPVYIISDEPEEKPAFHFEDYAATITGIIANRDNRTPLVIGINGHWGSGKTTQMKAVQSFLKKNNERCTESSPFRTCKTVWFQAWKYKDEDEILAALIEEIFKAMKKDNFFEQCKAEVEGLIKKFQVSKAIGKIADILAGVDISELFTELGYKKKLGFYDTFQEFFDRLLWTYLNWRPQSFCADTPNDKKGVLVIFIDDLDRCPNHKIVKVLETIKLFLDKKGCVFVIGAAYDIIEKALEELYGKEDAAKFMEKIVNVTFTLPQPTELDLLSYIGEIGKKAMSEDVRQIEENLKLITNAVKNNPRRLKQFLNKLSLQQALLRNRGIEIAYNNQLYWSIIDNVYPGLRDEIKGVIEKFYLLRKIALKIPETVFQNTIWKIPDEILPLIPDSFRRYFEKKDILDIIRKFDITRDELEKLITFSEAVKGAEAYKESDRNIKAEDFDGMTKVEAGNFIYFHQLGENENNTIDYTYDIGIYPVTNIQYARFIKADGYRDKDYWTDKGWQWKEKNNITIQLDVSDHPVVGRSYYEAEAYANWWSTVSNSKHRLPTEKEWEKAARGTDGRIYPWGDVWDKYKCNTSESGIGHTTAVTCYPHGISPYGCYDMAGNVWEWCSDWYDKEKMLRVLRGGSWSFNQHVARTFYRGRFDQGGRSNLIGFRLVRTL